MTMIPAYIAAVAHVANITKTLLNTRTQVEADAVRIELSGAVLDLQSKVFDVQAGYSQLLEANEALQKKIVEYERWDQERARYSLRELAPGIVAYGLNPKDAAGEPQHWICAACYQEAKKSIIYPESNGSDIYVCPRDARHILMLDERM